MLQKEALLRQITDSFNFSPDEAEAALLLLDTRAANLDMSLDDYMQTYHPQGFSQKDPGLSPEYKGYVQFLAQDAKAIITTGKTADFSTFVHENAHIFRRQLAGDLKAKAEKAFKVEGGNWTRAQEEYFAIGFEEYIRLRMAESEDLRQVFEKGARCMQHIYNGLDRIVELNPEIIKVYDELFTESRFRFNQKRFEKTVKDIDKNSLEKFKASHVYLGMTPPIYQEIGFERLPVMITAKHLKNVMQDWGSDTNVNYHGLTPDIIAQIPEAIKKPLVIMQSQNVEHPEDIIAVVELKDKDNKPIIIPFSPNKKGYVNDIQVDINLAKTIYGKDNFNAFIQRAVQENRILFINEKSQVLAIPRVQFPSNQGSRLLYDNIAQYRNIVKQKISGFAKLFQASAPEEMKAVREKYIDTTGYLKAPNGADTNLTERQWLQVRTPSFKKWFGDWENTPASASKVLDENGEPRILYHGTDELFTEFKSKKIGKHGIDDGRGFYFTTDINYALKFTQSDIILPIFLNLRREISLTKYTINRTQALSIIKELDKSLTVNGEHSFLLNYGDVDTEGIQALCRKVLNLEYGASDNDVDFLGSLVSASGNENAVTKAAAKVLGSIGVRSPQNDGSCHFIVRESNQIKSATENIGSFDMTNNNILFQKSSYYSRETQKEKRAEDVNKIAGYFIKAIETNTAPWMKPWKSNEYIDDFNPVTKTTYSGINSMILPFIRETEFHSNDPRWYTFNNAKAQNYMVKKGAKATPIVFYGTVPIGKDGKALAVDEKGNPIGEAVRFRSTLRFYKVFHASQLGVPQFDKNGNLLRDETGAVISTPIEPFEQPKIETLDFKPITSAEKVLQQSGARIYHDQSDKSFYNPANDSIHLCPKEHYINETLYYGTALHELVHWTGAESRLNRDLKNYSISETARAREELIAEIGSYALCKDLKLDFNPQNSAAYVQSWCEILRDKPDEIMKATHTALEAKEYIQDFEHRMERVQSIRNNVQGENNMERGIQTNGRKSVREVGKEIWSLTNFSEGNIYGNDFETWYRECFPYTIHKAADNATEKILKGDRRYKDGSFIEMEAWEAKDGKPHMFFFDKEHFAEYYDERQAELPSAPLFVQEEVPTQKQTEFDFSGKELPCYNPTSGKLYQAQEFEEHLKAINSDDKRYLSQSDIIKFGFTIKSNARPILLKTEKIITGIKKNNYELLYNGKDIVGLPPAIGKEKTSVHQPVRSITVQREKDYGMEIG